MTDPILKVVAQRPRRGAYPVTVQFGEKVLAAGEVDPYKADDIDSFIRSIHDGHPGVPAENLRAELLQLAATSPAAGANPSASPSGGIPYTADDSGIAWTKPTREGYVIVPLTNFRAVIAAQVVRDDGSEQEKAFEIEAELAGREFRFIVPASRFMVMSWPTEQMGAEAILYPGSTVKDHARAAVQMLSPRPVPSTTTYTHTGWRERDGGLGSMYLHAGGAIGAEGPIANIRVDVPPALAGFELPPPLIDEALVSGIRATLKLLDLGPDHIMVPALAAPFRAAIRQCDFGLHFAGPSGVFKSELAALVQQHFGPGLDARHLPGSWSSTDNAMEGLLFSAKDAVAVVDDFAPCGGQHDVARWHQRADRVIRAQGNNAGRGRMRADGTLRPPKPPRGLILSTGEDIPKGQSLRARLLILEISKGDINADVLTGCQCDARKGVYAGVIAAFVQHLARRHPQICQEWRAQVEELRQQAVSSSAHSRTPEIVANLALGLRYFLSFAQASGAIGVPEADALWSRCWSALGRAASQQTGHQAASEPAKRFLELLTSALASGNAHLADKEGQAPENPGAWGWRQKTIGNGLSEREEWQSQGDRVGWLDDQMVLLDPDASYRVAQQMAGAGGDGLVVTPRTLRKRIAEKGLLIRQGGKDTLTVRRIMEGTTRSVLCLKPGTLCQESDEGFGEMEPAGGGNVRKVRKPWDDPFSAAVDEQATEMEIQL